MAAAIGGLYVKRGIGQYIHDPAMRNEVTTITMYKVLTAEISVLIGVGLGQFSGLVGDAMEDELLTEGVESMLASAAGLGAYSGVKLISNEELKEYVKPRVLQSFSC